jgi:threonine dehydratase
MTYPTQTELSAARERIGNRVHCTPLLPSATLASRCGAASISLKCENLQKTGSFKVRGALNAMLQLDDAARARGVVTVSAGNHAQAVAWSAAALGIKSTVVMPLRASESKAAASAEYGADVIRHSVHPDTFVLADKLAAEHGYTLIHPFDSRAIVCGTASVGFEILEQAEDTDVIVVPIGGGGLLAGILLAIKERHPAIRIYGVEPEGASSMRQSLDSGAPVHLKSLDTIADGLASPYAGAYTYPIIRDFVDDVVIVTDAEIAAAMAGILERCKMLAEPAGAAATAALRSGKIPRIDGKHVVALLSGGNVDLDRLPSLLTTT